MDHLDIVTPIRMRSYSKRLLATQVILPLLIVLSLFPAITPKVHASHVSAAAYAVSGTVFDDYNQNGTQDTTSSIVEPGINGVVVTAYNVAGTAIISATTSTVSNVLGQYTLAIPAGTGPVRVQFSNFGPTSSIADLTGLQQSNHAEGTSVQFVDGTQTTNTINLGLERPSEYCQNQPTLATNCYVVGDQTTANEHVLVTFPWTASGTTPSPTALANSTDVGSTWGLAYRRSSDSLFASAYLKRHAGFKPGGSTGAIYLISGANSATPGTPSLFVDLNVAVGAGTAGANPHDTSDYTLDAAPYDLIGKVSLGGMALSDDETTLYVMNLNDKKLYAIAVGTPPAAPVAGTITSTAVPTPSDCTSSDFRPFAVTSYHNLIYVGAVCSAESTVTGSLPLGDPTKLQAYVFVYTPGSGFTSTPIFQFPLNYTRHCANDAQYSDCNASGSANLNVGNPSDWNPWHPGYIGYRDLGHNSSQGSYVYPQPMFTGIAFDNGNLLLGLRDRYGDQTARGLLTPDGSKSITGDTAGDTLKACLNTPGDFSSGWTLESNATCGSIQTAGANNTRLGPGGGEYYYQNYYSPYHDNTTLGSVLQVPGSPSVATPTFDPVTTVNTGGIHWSSNTTGAKTNSYQVYNVSSTNFSKANGLGDLVAFCQSAPIEIGNRVWNDSNNNGIQEAGEAGISGVTVHLYAADGTTLLQTTTTDSTGAYYFTISAYTSYVVRIDNAADYASGGVLQAFYLTSANQDSSTHLIDSKATLAIPANPIGTGNYPSISIGSHMPGQNDDSFDVGLIQPPDLSITKTVALSTGCLVCSVIVSTSSTPMDSNRYRMQFGKITHS